MAKKSQPSSSSRSRSSSRSSRSSRGKAGSKTTTDHDEIREWAEARGGKPSCVKGTGGGGDAGILRIDFPGYGGGDSLQEITWDEFFEKFDEQGLALLYQERTAGGEESNFNKLVSRKTAARSRGGAAKSSRSSSSARGGAKAAATSGGKSAGGSGGKSSARSAGKSAGRSGGAKAAPKSASSSGKSAAKSKGGSAKAARGRR